MATNWKLEIQWYHVDSFSYFRSEMHENQLFERKNVRYKSRIILN
jgi:hypothetical protein